MMQAQQTELTLNGQSGNGERILVVDDSRETVRHLAQTILPSIGFNASFALDGATALDKIRSEKPDLVMLDLNLPEMTGIDVLQQLALEEHQPPVVLMTGGGSEQSAVEAFRLGVKDYLVKPFTIDEVVQTIRRTLDGHQQKPKQAEPEQLNVAQNEIRRHKDQLKRLLRISKSITELTDLNTIIDHVLRMVVIECKAEESLMWIPSGEQSQLRTYQHQLDNSTIVSHNTAVHNQYVTRVMQTGMLVRESDFSSGLNVGLDKPARSIMYAPIRIRNEVKGVLGISNLYAPHSFSEFDEMFLDAISEYTSIALTNAYTIQKSRSQHAARIRDLYSLVSTIDALVKKPTDQVIQDAIFHAYNRWQIEACSVWTADNSQRTVRFLTNMGMGTEDLENTELPFGEGFVGYVAESGKWIYSNAVNQHPRHHTEIDEQTGFQTRSILCVPLTYQGEVLGALQLLNRMDGDFTEKDIEQALSIGAVISIALHNLKQASLA